MTSSALLTNRTPFVVQHLVLPDGEGGEALVVIVKITLDVDAQGELALAEPGVGIHMVDEAWGEPGRSSPRCDSDLVLAKPRVDVLLDAHAHAPGGEPCEQVLVELHVADLHKTLLVSGDRGWIDDVPSRPQPFVSMPLGWERAYGGTRDREHVDERNPLGIGHAGAASSDPRVRSWLPNVEDPSAPMQQPSSVCTPVGFGVVGRAWLPRRTLAGTFDVAWKRERWPLAPRDFDPAFHQSAPRDQQLDMLRGGDVDHQQQDVGEHGSVLAEFGAELAPARFGRLHRGDEFVVPAGRRQAGERGLGGAALGGDLLAQHGGGVFRARRQPRRAEHGVDRQAARAGLVEAEAAPGGFERLDEVEDVGRAAARQRGDRVHLRLVVGPQDLPHRFQQLVRQCKQMGQWSNRQYNQRTVSESSQTLGFQASPWKVPHTVLVPLLYYLFHY